LQYLCTQVEVKIDIPLDTVEVQIVIPLDTVEVQIAIPLDTDWSSFDNS